MLTKGGTVTYTVSTYSSSDTTLTYVVVTADDGWREATVDDLQTIEIKEPVQEQDEPDTGERPVYFGQPRRLQTETPTPARPRQLASGYG